MKGLKFGAVTLAVMYGAVSLVGAYYPSDVNISLDLGHNRIMNFLDPITNSLGGLVSGISENVFRGYSWLRVSQFTALTGLLLVGVLALMVISSRKHHPD